MNYFAFLLFVASQPLWAAPFTGQIFDLKANPETDKPIYTVTHTEDKHDDVLTFHNVYAAPDGKEAVIEDVTMEKDQLKEFHVQQKQIEADGKVTVTADRVYFTYKAKDKDEKKSDEKKPDNFAVGPTIVPLIQKNWDKIVAGDTVKIRFAVPDRLETVGFELFKDKSSTAEKVAVKMKASSLIISALVNPLYFYFKPDGSHLLEMKGRTQPKKWDDDKFRDLDAFTKYKFE